MTLRLADIAAATIAAGAIIYWLNYTCPSLGFFVIPPQAKPGEEVQISLSEARPVEVYFNNQRLLPKKVLFEGLTLVVTVPEDARSGDAYFSVGNETGHSCQAYLFRVLPLRSLSR